MTCVLFSSIVGILLSSMLLVLSSVVILLFLMLLVSSIDICVWWDSVVIGSKLLKCFDFINFFNFSKSIAP